MANVLVNENSLTAIGEVLRSKLGETKIETQVQTVHLPIISKTPNAIDFSNHNGGYDNDVKLYDVVHIPGATTIKVKFAYQTEGDTWDYLQIAEGEYDESNFPTNTTKYGGNSLITVDEMTYSGDTLTFFFNSDGGGSNYLGYYAECRGYDASGNEVNPMGEAEVEVEVLNTYKPAEMAPAIDLLSLVLFPEIVFTGSQGETLNEQGRWDAVIETFGDKISTQDLTNIDGMFYGSNLKKIPFSINVKVVSSKHATQNVFQNCSQLEELPDMSGTVFNCNSFLFSCYNLKTIPDSWATDIDWSQVNGATYWSNGCLQNFFQNCYSLRSIPEALLKRMYNSSNASNANGQLFNSCLVLDEIVGFRGPNAALTSNIFSSYFNKCQRLKRLVFDMEDGAPRVENWTGQTIDLSQYVGYEQYTGNSIAYNAGITADKQVKDDATYQALKNDADYYTSDVNYSRYNHDSAVETINSLPDCSASGTNTIKFTGASGTNTDGGAINTLTEEEIAVATAKGWTVSLA